MSLSTCFQVWETRQSVDGEDVLTSSGRAFSADSLLAWYPWIANLLVLSPGARTPIASLEELAFTTDKRHLLIQRGEAATATSLKRALSVLTQNHPVSHSPRRQYVVHSRRGHGASVDESSTVGALPGAIRQSLTDLHAGEVLGTLCIVTGAWQLEARLAEEPWPLQHATSPAKEYCGGRCLGVGYNDRASLQADYH